MHPLDAFQSAPPIAQLPEALAKTRRLALKGDAGSSATFLAAALTRQTSRPALLIGAHIDQTDAAHDELASLDIPVLSLPALEVLPGETSVASDLLAARLAAARSLTALDPTSPLVIVASIQSLMQPVPTPAAQRALMRTLTRKDSLDPHELLTWLTDSGFARTDSIEQPGDVALRGGILDIYPTHPPLSSETSSNTPIPIRLDFFGNDLDAIHEIDPTTLATDRAITAATLITANPDRILAASRADTAANFLDLLPEQTIPILHETLELTEQARGYFERVTDAAHVFPPPRVFKAVEKRFTNIIELNQFSNPTAHTDLAFELPIDPPPPLSREVPVAIEELRTLAGTHTIHVFCQNQGELDRFHELLQDPPSTITAHRAYLDRGFALAADTPLLFLPYHELLHRYDVRRRGVSPSLKQSRAIDTFLDFAPGDYVVHRDHGIARYVGLTTMPARTPKSAGPVTLPSDKPKKNKPKHPKNTPHEEYLTLEFAGKARLHVPATTIDQVQKYIGGHHGTPPLSTLGGIKWKHQKQAVADSVKDLASEMLRVRAARQSLPGIRYPADTDWQREFEAEFPFTETDDQLATLAEIKKDMTSDRPMDRLICGDVGYGKTELAIRAAFKACEHSKQVAVLVPTTVLAEQHERTFKSRFADYPFRVESLSRFKTTKETNAVLASLRKGNVDVVIGTHRILSKDVKFNDLGLVVIDEEQRFGVEHKEKLLALRTMVDVITLSATPIPRTLHMSMLGLRDISSLTTPPVDRRAVVTEVIPYNERRIKQAIDRELAREGQIFFVHNRVHNIHTVADDIQRLAPTARIIVGHGQMPDRQLEQVILKFVRKQADILVSTTIIESGIDIPTANTMLINDADRFGLAELHQLRGRVGRYKHRAYCYLLLPDKRTVNEKAVKRLKAIEEYAMLGAGFKIAMRDLEIRGAGNLLGAEQSGHIAAVGYEMFCQLLETAVKELNNESTATPSQTSIEIGAVGIIPTSYIPSDQRRLAAYRRIATAATHDELARVRAELTSAYSDPPSATETLLDLAQLRIAAATLGIRSITVRERDVIFKVKDSTPQPSSTGVRGGLPVNSPTPSSSGTGVPPVYSTPSPHPTTSSPVQQLLTKLQGIAGSVRTISPTSQPTPTGSNTKPQSTDQLTEVYYRPPPPHEQHLEPNTLLPILRKRLCTS